MYVQLPGGFILPWRTKILSESRQVGQSWGWKWSFLVWYLVTSVQCLCSVVLGTPTSSKDLKIFIFIIQYPSAEGLKSLICYFVEKKSGAPVPLLNLIVCLFFCFTPEMSYTQRCLKEESHGFLLKSHQPKYRKSHAILRTKRSSTKQMGWVGTTNQRTIW